MAITMVWGWKTHFPELPAREAHRTVRLKKQHEGVQGKGYGQQDDRGGGTRCSRSRFMPCVTRA